MSAFKRLDVRTEIDTLARVATPATPIPKSSKNSESSRAITHNSGTERAFESVSDETLALAISAFLSPYVAASEVEKAWDSLTDHEKLSIPEREFQALRSLPTDTIVEQIAWRDSWLKALTAVVHRRGNS